MLISRNLAVAMINCDYTGLTQEEILQIDDFTNDVPDFFVTNWNEESNDINGICAISRKWDHCVEIEKMTHANEGETNEWN